MCKHILLTGSSGMLGRALVSFLEKKQYKVFTLSRSKQSDLSIDLSTKTLSFSKCQEEKLAKVDCIIHTAFSIPKSKNEDNETLYKKNKCITDNVLNISNRFNIEKLINISSIAVYNIKSGTFSEKNSTSQLTNWNANYGKAKLYSENSFADKYNGRLVNLRVSQLFDNLNFQDFLSSNFLETIKASNYIEVFGGNNREINFISMTYLLKVIHFFMQNEYEGTYNTGEIQMKYIDFADYFLENIKKDDVDIVRKFPQNNINFQLDTSKLDKLLLSSKIQKEMVKNS